MPTRGSSEGGTNRESGTRRTVGRAEVLHPVPTGESTEESGPPRLYASRSSTSSTSTEESGVRRLYTSPSTHGQYPARHRTVKSRS